MPISTQEQSEKIFHKMIDLLEELMATYVDFDTEKEPQDGKGESEFDDIIDVMIEEAEDRGLDGELTRRFIKAAIIAARKSTEL